MNYKFSHRLLVQKPNSKAIYSIPAVSASVTYEWPFSVPQMDIEVLSQAGATDYIAPIRFDDIVRYQVAMRFNDYEKVVWQDLFSGRIQTPETQFQSGKNTAHLHCTGHSEAARTTLLEPIGVNPPMSFATGAQIFQIFIGILDTYGHRICYDPGYDQENQLPQNTDTTDYQIKPYQKYLHDFFQDFEKVCAYQWYFKERPRYNSDGTLITPTIIDFLPVPGTPLPPVSGVTYTNQLQSTWNVNITGGIVTSIVINGSTQSDVNGTFTLASNDTIQINFTNAPIWNWIPTVNRYKVIEGTPRLLSANFQAKGDQVYTRAVELGSTYTGEDSLTYQYMGSADNLDTQTLYGVRTYSETDTGFGSIPMCEAFAAGIVEKFCYPINAGQVVLQLTPEAHICDYIPVTIPSCDLNGSSIKNYFLVTKVQHDISPGSARTTIDVGYPLTTPESYIIQFAKMAHLSVKNFNL